MVAAAGVAQPHIADTGNQAQTRITKSEVSVADIAESEIAAAQVPGAQILTADVGQTQVIDADIAAAHVVIADVAQAHIDLEFLSRGGQRPQRLPRLRKRLQR
ncbi:hypothetical protein MSIMFI_05594 [Mycobacterium simulans]|nr:hypothetical protein MSIMFI_05594 [Mycobacterium simulans]